MNKKYKRCYLCRTLIRTRKGGLITCSPCKKEDFIFEFLFGDERVLQDKHLMSMMKCIRDRNVREAALNELIFFK